MKRSIGSALAAAGNAPSKATVRLTSAARGTRHVSPAEWAKVRHSPEVDAYVLAWIASHKPTAQLAKG